MPPRRPPQRLVNFAIALTMASLVALAIQSYRQPDAEFQPAPFSCSIVKP